MSDVKHEWVDETFTVGPSKTIQLSLLIEDLGQLRIERIVGLKNCPRGWVWRWLTSSHCIMASGPLGPHSLSVPNAQARALVLLEEYFDQARITVQEIRSRFTKNVQRFPSKKAEEVEDAADHNAGVLPDP